MARYYVSITLLIYLLALCFDAVRMTGGNSMAALQMLIYGPWGVVFGMFGWFANPLLGLALLLRRRFRWPSLVIAGWALYLALASWNLDRLPNNRSYDFFDVTGFAAGYYLWVLAIAAFCAGQAWWCYRGRDEVPRWSLPDGGLAVLLVTVVVMATQNDSLRFKLERAFEPPPSWQYEAPRRDEAI